MKIVLDELRRHLLVESMGKTVLSLDDFPINELRTQLRDWITTVSDDEPRMFCFESDSKELHGLFRIEPRPVNWQFTSWKERRRSSELLTLAEWRSVLSECGVC